MDQMSTSAAAIDDSTPTSVATSNSILGNVEAIQGQIGLIRTETSTPPLSQGELDAKITNIDASLTAISLELGNVDSNLANVTIAQ